jgi:hypothetical protein
MTPQLAFWLFLFILLFLVIYFDLKFNMLRDTSVAKRKPYSFARVQLAWWTIIVLTSFITIVATKGIPTFHASALILLGISSATTATARLIDQSDQSNPIVFRNQNSDSQGIILDILSDGSGVNIHRFQAIAFNLTFGIWFLCYVYSHLYCSDINAIMPVLEYNNLTLLGLSSGVYAALKSSENKASEQNDQSGHFVRDEAVNSNTSAKG